MTRIISHTTPVSIGGTTHHVYLREATFATPEEPRAVPEATVIPVVSPHAMAQWLTILSADWAPVTP